VRERALRSDGRGYVNCGRPWLDVQVIIVDPETRTRSPDGGVGEIWVGGPSVAAGYWGREEETAQTFRAFLSNEEGGPFLRTGDLGFLEDGELYITGRIKEVIVIRGRNHNPEDIEQTVQSAHPGLRANCGAAFEFAHDGEPRLVVVQEVQRGNRHLDVEHLLGDVRHAVADRHGLNLHDLQLLEHGSLPKTSSGKIQRHRCRQGYEQGTLKRWHAKEKP
jgi:acyl-CoA synthetase (AMP-forming)/AMP-acid ligase II